MPTRTTAPRRPRRGPLRSPLAGVPDARAVTIEEFRDYLCTVNNRDGRPYEDATISAYIYPAKALDAWLTAHGVDGDFTIVDADLLNRCFRDYYQER
jgi:integrase/recombinase XerD